jgi:hypothetical protein
LPALWIAQSRAFTALTARSPADGYCWPLLGRSALCPGIGRDDSTFAVQGSQASGQVLGQGAS